MLKLNPGIATALASAGLFSGVVHASSFASHVPPDSMLYLRWNGPALLRGYKDSRLRGIMQNTGLSGEIVKMLNTMFPLGAAQNTASALARLALRHQGAVAVVLNRRGRSHHASGASFLALRAGTDTALTLKLMNQVVRYYAPRDINSNRIVTAYRAGAYVVLQESDGQRSRLFKARHGLPAFAALLAKVNRGADASFYMNVAAARHDSNAGPRRPAHLTGGQVARRIIGVPSIHTIAVGFAFSGRDCRTNVDVTFLGKPKGWIGSLAEPTSKRMLKYVPENAADFVLTSVNLTGDLAAIMAAAKKHETLSNFEVAVVRVERIEAKLHGHLLRDILTPLSGTWAIFQTTGPGGALTDPVLVHPLRENNMYLRRIIRMGIQFSDGKGPFAPMLDSSHKILYIGLNRNATLAAVHRGATGQGITKNKEFITLKKRLHVPPGSHAAYSFAETGPLARRLLTVFKQQIQPALRKGGAMSPGMRAPKFSKLSPYLSPAAGASWFNASGYHMKWIGPMPGAQFLDLPAWAAGPSGKMLPRLFSHYILHAYRGAQSVRAASHLRDLGMAAIIYQDTHPKPLPGVATLVASGLVAPKSLIDPASHHTPLIIPPADAHNRPWIKKHLAHHDDFAYFGKGVQLNKARPEFVLAIDPRRGRAPNGILVLYVDGHVEGDSKQTLKAAIAATNRQRAKMGLPAITSPDVLP